MSLDTKFARMGTENAPGQEVRQDAGDLADVLRGAPLEGRPVDFSHGDVDAFTPTPGSFDLFAEGVETGGAQAYTEYRGDRDIRAALAARLADFTGAPINADEEMILTPGTQGALFLAMAATVGRGDKVAIVRPDYFANRKLVEFFEGEVVPVDMDYADTTGAAGLDLGALERAFAKGVKVFVFSNPNNPTGVVYSAAEITRIAELARAHGVTVIVDQLYARMLYTGTAYTHLRAEAQAPDNVITIIGPSKTESLSGYRLGVAFGAGSVIARMEKVQAIVSLRAPGYSQAVLRSWFAEPEGWLAERVQQHEAIRDALVDVLSAVPGVTVRPSDAGSYLFPCLPELSVSPADFVRILRVQGRVIVTPGSEFSPHAETCIRLNYSQDHAAAVAAAERIATLIERYRA